MAHFAQSLKIAMGCGATKTKVTKVAPQEPEGPERLTAIVTDASDTSSQRGKARLCSVTGRSETAEIECRLACA